MDRNIPVWLSSPVQELVVEHDGVAERSCFAEGKRCASTRSAASSWPAAAFRMTSTAEGAVPARADRQGALLAVARGEHRRWSSPGGIGRRRVDVTIPNAAAWVPTSVTTRPDGSKGVMPHFIDRAKPGVIAVTPKGKRFTNEGDSYHDFVQDMVRPAKGEPEVSAWLLCDHHALRNYGLGCVAPFPLPFGATSETGI